MKRILFYSYEYPPLGGGIANAVSFLMREFAQKPDLTIDIITSSLENRWNSEQLSERITFHYVPIGKKQTSLHKQSALNMLAYTIGSFLRTIELSVRNRYTIAHVFGYPGALVAFLFSWWTPYIVSLRGVDVPGYNPKFAVIDTLYRPLVRLTWLRARNVIANSTQFADLARQTAPGLTIPVIPNGVDSTLFQPTEDRFPQFTVTAGATLMGPKKGLPYLIEGFAAFAKTRPDVRLLLIGSGSMQTELEHLVRSLHIPDQVTFAGRKDKAWVAKTLPRCHVFCLPSLTEGMSNATLEAMACGLPLIITDTGGSAELVQGNGFVIPKRDSAAIADCLGKLYQNAVKRKRYGEISRKRAEEFTWEKVADDYYREYRR